MPRKRESKSKTPTIKQRQLGNRLKEWREASGKSQEDGAAALMATRWTVWRMEKAKTTTTPGDIRALGYAYGISPREVDEWANFALTAHMPGWVDPYREAVSDEARLYADLQAHASNIKAYCPEMLHGLLQTADYARSILDAAQVSDAMRAKRLAFKLETQTQVFQRKDVPAMSFVIGESALRYVVGSRDVMSAQIEHLFSLSNLVSIRIWPFSIGPHLWMTGGSFTLLRSSYPGNPEVAYVEGHITAEYLEDKERSIEYAQIFDHLLERSVPIEDFQWTPVARFSEQLNRLRP